MLSVDGLLLGVEDTVYVTIEFNYNRERENNENNSVTYSVSSTPCKSKLMVKASKDFSTYTAPEQLSLKDTCLNSIITPKQNSLIAFFIVKPF